MTAHQLSDTHKTARSNGRSHQKASSIDPIEMAHFAKMAEDWWNPRGKFRPLHIMNTCRVGYLVDEICAHFKRDRSSHTPLAGLLILDVGCGGGLLSEPLSRLGADVTGVDALKANIKAARLHAKQSGLDIKYKYMAVEDMPTDPDFDIVLNMEVLEHVTDPATFIKTCAALVKPDGLMFCSTINRTAKAFALAIFGAEYILGWLPKGTHQYAKFIKPEDMRLMLEQAGLKSEPACGMVYNPLTSDWQIRQDVSVNYLVKAVNPQPAGEQK